MILPGWIGKTYHRMNRKMAFISGISGVKRDGEMKKNMMVFWICLLLGILSVHLCGNGSCDRFRHSFFPYMDWYRDRGVSVWNFRVHGSVEKGSASGKNLCRNDCLYRTACVLYRRGLCDQPDARGWTRGLDYIIVLGAQVRKDYGPSPVLKYRLDKAVEYLNENPDTVCIVSGGQGSNEPWSEAEGMARYLQEKKALILRGFCRKINRRQPSRISRTVKMLMKEGASVGIVTNNFHVFRALQIAKKYGLSDVCGIAADSTPKYLPNNMLREFFAEMKWLL